MNSRFFTLFFILLPLTLWADFDYTLENTNITILQGASSAVVDDSYLYNYDRLRFRGDYTEDEFFATLILDGVNYLGSEYVNSATFSFMRELQADVPFETQSNFYEYNKGTLYAKVYRLYAGYEDDKNRAVIGLQNISMGVGRIWTPTNLFNPRNIYAIEPDEVYGVAALSYTRHLGETSKVMVVASQKEDDSFKYGAQYRAFLDFIDVGVDVVSSDETKMLGLELEANLADTGVELRAEASYIEGTFKTLTDTQKEDFYQGIVGADYGFVNGITLIGEVLYSTQTFSYAQLALNLDSEILPNLLYSELYTALSLSYSFNIFLDGSLLYIESFSDENSRFVSPTLTYTLNDYNSFNIGAMLQNGSKTSEFGSLGNSTFFKWSLSF